MIQLLTQFTALSMAGTILLSLLPDGGMKRTAGMAIGILTLLCWAEGIGHLLEFDLTADPPLSVLTTTSINLQDASMYAIAAIQEASP